MQKKSIIQSSQQLWLFGVLAFMLLFVIGCIPSNPYLDQYFSKPNTGTYLQLTVRETGTNRLVSGALVQVSGRGNDVFRQGKTNSSGVVRLTDLVPGTYVVRAWKGRKASEDTIYIKGAVSALMRI